MPRLNWNCLTADERTACIDQPWSGTSYGPKFQNVWTTKGRLSSAWEGDPGKTNGDRHRLFMIMDEPDNCRRIWGKKDASFAAKHSMDIDFFVAGSTSDSAQGYPLIVIEYHEKSSKKYADNLRILYLECLNLEQRGYKIVVMLTRPELSAESLQPIEGSVDNDLLEDNPNIRRLGGSRIVLLLESGVDTKSLHVATCGGVIRAPASKKLYGMTTAHNLVPRERDQYRSSGAVYALNFSTILQAEDVWNPRRGRTQFLGSFQHNLNEGRQGYSMSQSATDDWLLFEVLDRRYDEHNCWNNGELSVHDPDPLTGTESLRNCWRVLVGTTALGAASGEGKIAPEYPLDRR